MLLLLFCVPRQNYDLGRELGTIDIRVMEVLRNLLRPFKDATVVMSTESSSSISLIRPLMKQLMRQCDNTGVEGLAPSIHQVRQIIFNDMETRCVLWGP